MPSSTEHEQEQDSCSLCCSLIYQTVPSSTKYNTVVANAMTKNVNLQDKKKNISKIFVDNHGSGYLGMARHVCV